MSSVWFCIPAKKPAPAAQECVDKWRARGYRVALWRDSGDAQVDCDLLLVGAYPGYAAAVNALCLEVLDRYPETEWLVTGGDDIDPDPNHSPEEIAQECSSQFWCYFELMYPPNRPAWSWDSIQKMATFGIVQPTGDRWGADPTQPNHVGSAYADRVCGSPWMGAEFCRRMYGGTGPLWSGWRHMRVDEELFEVAKAMGVLWQRPDLTHYHRHWGRAQGAQASQCPDYLKAVNGPQHWQETTALFEARKAAGFPGHEPLAVEACA